MVKDDVMFIILIIFILRAVVPYSMGDPDRFKNRYGYGDWFENAKWFELTYNTNIYVYLTWNIFETITRFMLAIVYYRALWIL